MNNSKFNSIFNQNIPDKKLRPLICVGNQNLETITPLAWEALRKYNDPPTLYLYGDCLVRIEGDDSGNITPVIIEHRILTHELARRVTFYSATKTSRLKKRSAQPPRYLIDDIFATPRQSIPLPRLKQIITVPQFLSNGTIHDVPGYDAVGQTLYVPANGFQVPPIPPNPSPIDLEAAKGLLFDELLEGFPFKTSSERTNLVGLLIQPFVRGLINGPAPII